MPLIKFVDNEGTAWALPLEMGINGLPRFHMAEVRHIERVADMGVREVTEQAFVELNGTALSAVVQVLWKRQGRVVKFDDVDFDIGSMEFELLPDEEDDDDTAAGGGVDPVDPTSTSSGGETGEG